MSRRLDPQQLVPTLQRLRARISERFPQSGLAQVCDDLFVTARATAERARAVRRPYLLLRGLTVVTVLGLFAIGYFVLPALHLEELFSAREATALTQGLESFANLVILAGAAIWFLMSFEERIKRRRILAHLHELRSFAHVIDMHQLTKDPTVILNKAARTASSPSREMTEFELARYLDYCSEMLAHIGKLAALYAEESTDSEVIAAINDIESLTGNLGRKIWQKIMIISRLDETRAERLSG